MGNAIIIDDDDIQNGPLHGALLRYCRSEFPFRRLSAMRGGVQKFVTICLLNNERADGRVSHYTCVTAWGSHWGVAVESTEA